MIDGCTACPGAGIIKRSPYANTILYVLNRVGKDPFAKNRVNNDPGF